MKIPKFKLEFDLLQIELYKSLVHSILTEPSPISNGEWVRNFENRFSKSIGSEYAIAVGSGTDALECAVRVLNIRDKFVLFPTNTMIGTAIAIERAGSRPMPVDIENEGFSINPEALKAYIQLLGKFIGAVIIVHIGGNISPKIDDVLEICKDNGIPVIEDAAQAHFATRDNHMAGTMGDVGCFSFSATKVMTTGEGGMVTTHDKELADIVRSIRNFGSHPGNAHLHTITGSNFKMTEIQAALGYVEMDRVERRIQKRKDLSKIYMDELDDSIYNPIDMGDSSYYKQIVRFDKDRTKLKEYCKSKRVGLTGEVYPIPIHRQPVYNRLWDHHRFPIAEEYCNTHICPPNYPELTEEEVKYVCEVMNSYVALS